VKKRKKTWGKKRGRFKGKEEKGKYREEGGKGRGWREGRTGGKGGDRGWQRVKRGECWK